MYLMLNGNGWTSLILDKYRIEKVCKQHTVAWIPFHGNLLDEKIDLNLLVAQNVTNSIKFPLNTFHICGKLTNDIYDFLIDFSFV